MTEKDLVLGQVEALFNLGTHACSTLRKCVNFRLKQGDDVKKEATELAGEHVDMQQSYKLGGVEEYDKINKLQSSVDGGMFYTQTVNNMTGNLGSVCLCGGCIIQLSSPLFDLFFKKRRRRCAVATGMLVCFK